jgi:hypothetical protein
MILHLSMKFRSFTHIIFWVVCLGCFWLTACQGNSRTFIPRDDGSGIFLPPPLVATMGPRVTKTPTPDPRVTPTATVEEVVLSTPECSDRLSYLEDLSIPDGTHVQPGQKLDKQWQVGNSGTCNWTVEYQLHLSAGPDLDTPKEQALFPARSGTQATIRILFTAPKEPGNYRSAWQAYNPQGTAFGDTIFIDFVVDAPTATP